MIEIVGDGFDVGNTDQTIYQLRGVMAS